MTETFFGKIARNQTDVELIHQDETCVAFADIAPQAPIHLLVIPREPFESAVEADAQVLGHVMKIAAQLGAERCPNGFRLVTNIGDEGGQSVPHLHVHVLGGRALQWPPG